MDVKCEVVNAREVAAGFIATAVLSEHALEIAVRRGSQMVKRNVQKRASGRPGPNVITGDYRRAVSMTVRKTAAGVAGYIGTNKAQGRRLEFGFVGFDSLGRYYDQPPFPHWGPGFDESIPYFESELDRGMDLALLGTALERAVYARDGGGYL